MERQGEPPNQRAALPLVAAPDAAPTVPGGRSDYFGRLPDHLLLRILLKVGTKQAVKMGGVSRQWRRVWTQLPVLESDGVDSSVPARALAAYQAHGEDDIHSLTVSPNQVDGNQTAAWLSLAAPLLSGVLYFDIRHTMSRETLQLFLHDVEEAVTRRGAFELPCFKKAAVIRMDLGFLGIALPPAGVFHALRVMRPEHFWFRGQLSLSDNMLPSLRDLFIRRVRGLTILMLSSKSLLDIHLCLLPELRQLNILAPRLEELEVTGCFYVLEPVATIAAERLEILKWEVPCVPELGEMPHLRMEGQGKAPNQRAALPLVAAPTIPGGSSDHFSRLPDHLLVHILLRIPTKKAVEMSALSRQWRGVWTQLPILKFDGVESSVPAHALAVYRAHGGLDIHSFTVYTNQMDAQDAAAWLSLLAPLLTGRLYFDNTDDVSPETLQLLLQEEEAEVPRDAFELPCFKKATEIWMDLGFLCLAMPPAAVFDVLRVMWLERFWFRGQFSLSNTMLPSLQKLTIRRVRGLVRLMLNSKSLLYIQLSLLVEIQRINILAPRLEELDVTSCFYDVPEPVASIDAERLQILRWEVPCVPKPVSLRKIPHLLVLGAPPISTLWLENICADFLDCFPVVDRLELQISLGVSASSSSSCTNCSITNSWN